MNILCKRPDIKGKSPLAIIIFDKNDKWRPQEGCQTTNKYGGTLVRWFIDSIRIY